MLEAERVLRTLAELPGVTRVLLVGASCALSTDPATSGGTIALDASLRALLSATRPLFFDLRPAVSSVWVRLREGELLVAPCGRNVLLVRGATSAADVLALAENNLATLASDLATPRSVPPSSAVSRARVDGPTEAAFLLRALNTVLATLKASVGGAVLRNYARRAQQELSPQHPVVDAVSIDLSGVASFTNTELGEGSRKGQGIRALVEAIMTRAAVVAPEIKTIDVDGLLLAERDVAVAVGFRRDEAGAADVPETNRMRAFPQKESAT